MKILRFILIFGSIIVAYLLFVKAFASHIESINVPFQSKDDEIGELKPTLNPKESRAFEHSLSVDKSQKRSSSSYKTFTCDLTTFSSILNLKSFVALEDLKVLQARNSTQLKLLFPFHNHW